MARVAGDQLPTAELRGVDPPNHEDHFPRLGLRRAIIEFVPLALNHVAMIAAHAE